MMVDLGRRGTKPATGFPDRIGDLVGGILPQVSAGVTSVTDPADPGLEGFVGAAGAGLLGQPHELGEGEGAGEGAGFEEGEVTHVGAFHGEDQFGVGESFGGPAPAAEPLEVATPFGDDGPRVAMGGFALEHPAEGTDLEMGGATVGPDPEEGLGHGGTADVAGAGEEDVDGSIVGVASRPPS